MRAVIVVLGVLIAAIAPARAQGVVEWSTETRTTLSLQVRDAAVSKLLPAGWTLVPSTAPANRGANLTVTLMERLAVLDPQGQPVRSGMIRYATITAPARNTATGQAGTLVIAGLSPDAPGAYDVYLPATVTKVERASSAEGEHGGTVRESWEFAASSGDRLELRLSYRRAAPVKSRAETVVRSGRRPEFSRTYRIDQTSDVLRSLSAAEDRIDSLQFRGAGPMLGALFDGSERILSVTAVPFYAREISIP